MGLKISQFQRLGVSQLKDDDFITALKAKRSDYGVSQTRLALMAGISREHLNRIEAGTVALTEDMKTKLLEAVEKFNPDEPLFLLFDYVRIRFPTMDIKHVIKNILKLNIDYMLMKITGTTNTPSITISGTCLFTLHKMKKKAYF